jgi:hypothetical protein
MDKEKIDEVKQKLLEINELGFGHVLISALADICLRRYIEKTCQGHGELSLKIKKHALRTGCKGFGGKTQHQIRQNITKLFKLTGESRWCTKAKVHAT